MDWTTVSPVSALHTSKETHLLLVCYTLCCWVISVWAWYFVQYYAAVSTMCQNKFKRKRGGWTSETHVLPEGMVLQALRSAFGGASSPSLARWFARGIFPLADFLY